MSLFFWFVLLFLGLLQGGWTVCVIISRVSGLRCSFFVEKLKNLTLLTGRPSLQSSNIANLYTLPIRKHPLCPLKCPQNSVSVCLPLALSLFFTLLCFCLMWLFSSGGVPFSKLLCSLPVVSVFLAFSVTPQAPSHPPAVSCCMPVSSMHEHCGQRVIPKNHKVGACIVNKKNRLVGVG